MPAPSHLDANVTPHGNLHIPALDVGPAICADDVESRSHEWLLTNGRGGYACGSIAGTLDRRYHAYLAAALEPPDTRTVVLAKVVNNFLCSSCFNAANVYAMVVMF